MEVEAAPEGGFWAICQGLPWRQRRNHWRNKRGSYASYWIDSAGL